MPTPIYVKKNWQSLTDNRVQFATSLPLHGGLERLP